MQDKRIPRNACLAGLTVLGSRSVSFAHRRSAALLLLALQGGIGVVLAEEACAPKAFRWEEDGGGLEVEGSLSVLDHLRYIPLSDSRLVRLTLGAEYRFKSEYLNAPNWALKPGDIKYTAADIPVSGSAKRFFPLATIKSSLICDAKHVPL
jgi:hypothetical protein